MSELFSVPEGLSLQDEDRQRPAEFDAQIAAGANLAAMLDAEQQRNNAVLVAQPPELHVSALDFNCLHPELADEVVLPISIPRLRTDDKGALHQVHTVRPVVISNEKVQAILNTSGIDGNSPGVAQLPEVLPNREFPVHVAPPDRVVLDIPVTEITVFAKPLAIAGQPGGPGFGTTRLIIKNAAGAPVLDKNIPVRSARSAENYYCYIAPRPSKHLLPKRAQKRDDPSAAASPPNKRQRASLSCEEQHSPLPGVPAAAAQPPVHDEQQLFLDEVFATANDTVEEHYPKG